VTGSYCPSNWTCNICNTLQPDDKIAVARCDVSEQYALDPGTMMINTRYCSDNETCKTIAHTLTKPSDLRYVHFAWNAGVKNLDDVCRNGRSTDDLGVVSCPWCREKIVSITNRWMGEA